MSQDKGLRSCETKAYKVYHKDLPASCPLPAMRVWDAHPRVYLPLEEIGQKAVCPYCGANYELVEA